MRTTLFLLVLGLLVSCGPQATLVVDDSFQAVAPEIIGTWGNLVPFKDAKTIRLPGEGNFSQVLAVLRNIPAGSAALVGAALSVDDCRALTKEVPAVRLTFLTVPAEGLKTISLDKLGARAAVAKSAADQGTGRAAVIFSPGTTSSESALFVATWKADGGGPMEVLQGPPPFPLPTDLKQMFLWDGPDRESWAVGIPASVLVNGNPGTPRGQGSKGFEWALKADGLGDYLWDTAFNIKIKSYFLPVETVFIGR